MTPPQPPYFAPTALRAPSPKLGHGDDGHAATLGRQHPRGPTDTMLTRSARTRIALILLAAITAAAFGTAAAALIGSETIGLPPSSSATSKRPDDDDGSGDGDSGDGKEGDAGKTGDDDGGKAGAGSGADEDDDDDGTDSDLARARAAARRYKSERDNERRAAAEREREAAEKAGNWEKVAKSEKDRADQAEARVAELEEQIENGARERLVTTALEALNVRNASRALRLIDPDELKDVETKRDAERLAKALKRSDDYLFDESRSRSKRGAGHRDDDDTGDDDTGSSNGSKSAGKSKPLVGAQRMARAYGSSKT